MSNKKDASLPHADLSRRQFLVRSAGVAGVSMGIGVRPEKAQGESGDSNPLRVALIGAGQRGMKLLSTLCERDDVCVVAVVEPDPRRRGRARILGRDSDAGRKNPNRRGFTDLDALIRYGQRAAEAKEPIDAVLIASPPHRHHEQALQTLAAGWHVYLEKPMALTVSDCDAVLRAALEAEERGQVFQMGFQRRYDPRYQASVAAIRRGDAGPSPFVRAQWHAQSSPAPTKAWFYDRDRSGDLVVEQACHQIDVFNWMFDALPDRACGFGGRMADGKANNGPPTTTGDFGTEVPSHQSVRDHYGLLLEYPNGGRVLLSHVSFAVPDRRFAGVEELVFGENLGVELGTARAWDRQGRARELLTTPSPHGISDTRLAIDGFLGHVRSGDRPHADARAGHRATVAALFALAALDSSRTLNIREFLDA